MPTVCPCPRRFRLWFTLLLAAALPVFLGCGSGPKRHRISGKVTFQGRTVPAGEIIFNPDVSKGKDGVQGFALIRDGAYDTGSPGGKGVGAGPHVVVIRGYDGKPRGELPFGAPLFPEREEKVELPGERTTRDFNVPDPAKR
jgi:hypothetical protein